MWRVARCPPRDPNRRKGEMEASSLFKTSSICGEADIPSFPRGAHVEPVVLRGAASKGPEQGCYHLARVCVREGGDEGAGLPERFNPLPNGSIDKHPPLSLLIVSILCS